MSTQNFRIHEHKLPCTYVRQYPRATVNGDQDELSIAIKQYVPLSNQNPRPGDVTIIAAHANGVGKELYEPVWDDLLAYVNKTGAFRIHSIWMADVAGQGESGVLNEKNLGNEPSWFDHPRDLLHMVNTFRAEMARPIIGIGHSMGGHNIVQLSLMHPRLLHSVILIDPVIQRGASAQANYSPAYLSTFRRDLWASRAEAEAAMRKNKFYQGWDPRCLKLWFQYGLREIPTEIYQEYPHPSTRAVPATSLAASSSITAAPVPQTTSPDKPVTLTTTKHQEVFHFLRSSYPSPGTPLSSYRPTRRTHPDLQTKPGTSPLAPLYRPEPLITFYMLPHLRPQTLYIIPSLSAFNTLEFREDKVMNTGTGIGGSGGVVEGAVEEILLEGRGHFAPFERPMEVVEALGPWLERQVDRWKAEEEEERSEWASVPTKDKARISKAWEHWVRGDYKDNHNTVSKPAGTENNANMKEKPKL